MAGMGAGETVALGRGASLLLSVLVRCLVDEDVDSVWRP